MSGFFRCRRRGLSPAKKSQSSLRFQWNCRVGKYGTSSRPRCAVNFDALLLRPTTVIEKRATKPYGFGCSFSGAGGGGSHPRRSRSQACGFSEIAGLESMALRRDRAAPSISVLCFSVPPQVSKSGSSPLD